jgi:hypothetical protein
MNEQTPFAGTEKWYKGNLHCHSTNSDSRRGRSMHANDGDTLTSASWKLGGNELYARVECQDRFGKTAWTNPIFYNPDFWKSYNDEDFEFLGY